jgi:predicted alpha-1,6-mannanase (GH76 family)
MRIQSYIFILGVFIVMISCSKNSYAEKRIITPTVVNQNFTDSDATIAYAAFNNFFYNKWTNLYYSTTQENGLAAIWTQAIFWDLAMDVYERTHDQSQLNMINNIYIGGYKHYDSYNWDNTTTWFIYDDMMWWITALARAYKITGNQAYLQKSIDGFNHVWEGSYDPVNGGMYWDFNHSGKNACINYPTVIAAMRLYKITGDTTYLTKAKSIYAWSRINLFNVSNGEVADHKIGNNPPGYQDYTYNQGAEIGAAVMLYETTGDTTYLADANLAANYTMNNMCDSNGILPAEGDFNEQGVLKTIFAQYIMQLINVAGQKQYLAWIQKNINYGWINRDRIRNLTYRDYSISCPSSDIQSYEASSIVTFMQLCPPIVK